MDTTQEAPVRFGSLQATIVVLTVATAVIHLTLAFLALPEVLTLFYLNGLGYLVLAAALYLPALRRWRNLIRWILILFAATTVIAWVAVGARNLIAYIDKIIEITLIVLLWMDSRR